VKLSPSVCRELGLKRHAVYRGIHELEEAGLVTVVRKRGCGPIITLCPSRSHLNETSCPTPVVPDMQSPDDPGFISDLQRETIGMNGPTRGL
jgi:hypothetical protein